MWNVKSLKKGGKTIARSGMLGTDSKPFLSTKAARSNMEELLRKKAVLSHSTL